MDSLTQFTLGAAISAVCLGNLISTRKAAVIGGVLGTLPDLDVLLPFETAVDSFVYHRGWSHSFFVQAAVTPIIGEGLLRLFQGLRGQRALTYWAVFLCFVTHSMIDAITVYGTRIFWPFYPDPVGIGSVFIIDPLYTLPLLVPVIWALCKSQWSDRLSKTLYGALIFTSGYLLLSIFVQDHIEKRAEQLFAEQNIAPDQIFAIAAPLNIVLWRVIGLEDGQYNNTYLSLLDEDNDQEIYTHRHLGDQSACLETNTSFQKLAWFSRGFYRLDAINDQIHMTDVRMGLTPNYVFEFAIADIGNGTVRETNPAPVQNGFDLSDDELNWFLGRLLGRKAVRASERALADAAIPEPTLICP